MEFDEVESKYYELKGRLEAGTLTPEEFQARVGRLQVQDAKGHYWTIDAGSGGWLWYDGAKWVPAQPSGRVSDRPGVAGRATLIAVVGAALLLCLIAVAGAGLILFRSMDEDSGVVTREQASAIAEDIIAEQFPDLQGADRTIGSYENPAGTPFWNVTYRRGVETRVEGQTYTIPRIVVVSVNKETGETILAVSN